MSGFSLAGARVATRLPAQDLDRARRWYAEKLGLEPADERPGGLLYRMPNGEFALYASQGESSGTFTQMALEVDDIDAAVAALRERGVELHELGVVDIEGQYPSKHAVGERATWFYDSERNLIGIGQLLPD